MLTDCLLKIPTAKVKIMNILDQLLEAYIPPSYCMTLAYHVRSAGVNCTDAEAEALRNAPANVQNAIIEKIAQAAEKNGNKMIHARIVAFMIKEKKEDYESMEEDEEERREWQEDDFAF